MATGFLSPIGTPTQQFFSDQGVILSGGLLYTYLAGTTTPAPTFTTSNLSVSNPNPIVLNSSGRCPQEVWLQGGTQYKFVVTDANNNPLSVGTYDNISGINDTAGGGGAALTSEWQVSSLTPTFVDGTHFTVPGNQTALFSVNRRIYATVTAGTIYGTITASSFSSNTNVTVAWDSGTLDSGLSSIAYSILNPTNASFLSLVNIQILTGSGTYTPTNGANRAKIRAVGGGAAGGGTPSTAGSLSSDAGGGSAGTYAEMWVYNALQSLAGTAYTAGAGGTGVTGAGGNNGASTTFGGFITAPGGGGAPVAGTANSSFVGSLYTGNIGAVSAAATLSGGSVMVTVFTCQGGLGQFGVSQNNIAVFAAGMGGRSPLGSGGPGNNTASSANGSNASGYGSGGGGAASSNTATTYAGGNGSNGVIIVEEYL